MNEPLKHKIQHPTGRFRYTMQNERDRKITEYEFQEVEVNRSREAERRRKQQNRRKAMPETSKRVWRNDKTGLYFHDECFETDESREGYSPVNLNALEETDSCESCDGPFLVGPADDIEDDGEDDDIEEPES